MPVIIAICPYCRAGGVRAKDASVGASATCPKCKSSFTLIPEENLPDWAAKAGDAPVFSAPSAEKPKLPAATETRATAALPDVTEPSPVLPSDPKAKPAPAPAPARTQTPPATSFEPPVPADAGMVLALVALILVGPAVLASQLPYGRIIALVLTAAGCVGGLLCLGAEGKARLTAALAAGCHFVALLVLLLLPSWLNLDPWFGTPAVQEDELKKVPVAVEHGGGAARALSANDWLDAGRSSWQFRDTRVTVRPAVGPVALTGPNGAKRTTKESYFQLVVQVSNTGAEREIPLSGWASGQNLDGVRVTTSDGKELKPATFEAGWSYDRGTPAARAIPGNPSEVRWVFAAPPKTAEVRVQLPGAAVGVQNEIKVRATTVGLPPRGPVP